MHACRGKSPEGGRRVLMQRLSTKQIARGQQGKCQGSQLACAGSPTSPAKAFPSPGWVIHQKGSWVPRRARGWRAGIWPLEADSCQEQGHICRMVKRTQTKGEALPTSGSQDRGQGTDSSGRSKEASSAPARYRSFVRPRYRVAYKTVTDMEWRCCQGYGGDDCAEGPAPALGPALSTPQPQPRPRPARPSLSGSSAGSHLSGLGGEGEQGSC